MKTPLALKEALPALVESCCIVCEGEGGLEVGNRPYPELVKCSACEGRGVIEVCPTCGCEPWIHNGRELCGCIVTPLRDTMPEEIELDKAA